MQQSAETGKMDARDHAVAPTCVPAAMTHDADGEGKANATRRSEQAEPS